MTGKIDQINLFAKTHAIEVANFVINLNLPLDQADISRFDEKQNALKSLFPAITSPETFRISFGSPSDQFNPPPPVPVKELTYFANDGRPEWVGSFGDNQILVSCRKYTNWKAVWPEAKKRLDALLGCVDQYKTVHSVDYSVTDTFSSKKAEKSLVASNVFCSNSFLPESMLNNDDPRWDFSQGWFDIEGDHTQILVRIEARSGIQNDMVVASISNLHSRRFGPPIGVKDVSADDGKQLRTVFDNLHDKNKELLKIILRDELLVRMRLKENNDV